MEIREILAMVDHTVIKQGACWDDVRCILDEGVKYHAASACIPACYLKQAKDYAGSALPVGAVIGFPYGYSTTASKLFEVREALDMGADEIDMVINIGWLREKNDAAIQNELSQIKELMGDKILKVIIEACLLTDEEKIRACKLITDSKADYIKTSTGLAHGGATPHDIMLFAANIGPGVKIKAAGGVNTLEDARRFISLGASRVGSSRIIKALEGNQTAGY
ncbi:MAG: deoxyribose-phosphate aldolase [Oscillospiraceae bacterium]|nr:deoxyribose-phosphate aldolase [Oscillospiraceae bacterium]